jgi:ubiquinone/menaquinone biosynthesis C-methylase UbiE
MGSDIERWLKGDGQIYLKDIGIAKGHIVLDFGCGDGHYTIPAAKVVGKKGLVYAQDKDEGALDELIKKAKAEGLKNIKVIKTKGELKIDLDDKSLDAVLLYDVLHYHDMEERRKIYGEVYRILKKGALLSVFPRHHKEYMHLKLEEVKKEIEKANFSFEGKFFKRLIHDDDYVKDYVFNFRRR